MPFNRKSYVASDVSVRAGGSTALGRSRCRSPHLLSCLEVKLSRRWDRKWERPMRDLRALEGIQVDRMIGIDTGDRKYHFDGFDVWPVEEFLENLHKGTVF